jgi:thiol-disulfide isomerase/thioredoxin
MDRLPTLSCLATLALSLSACGEDIAQDQPVRARVEAVSARREDPAVRFCDVSHPVGQGPTLHWPQVEGALPTAGSRWINVWATWCAPCLEELPRIAAFKERLAAEGVRVETAFLSVDREASAIDAYRAEHPSTPQTAHLSDPGGLPALLTALGLDAGATIPIHVLIDAEDRLRCVRTGAIADSDYETIRTLVRGR